ncbi:Metal transporter cnnm-1, variant 2 [Parelaphostrongylus tenuis]|uniref:Metal transporter cnnm-1, variant 2 n=1 Tax=Parelaphostrongylus tenuis TaxID=148309 RepID=A0AAD5MS38_PARTN|nr:Metal transporter cnnm-1, variant 2 [Parelaphostrongylus tenuis]
MSLTPQELELVVKAGSPSEQKYASAILPVRKKGNLLLCALLLGNVIVNAAISILFGELTTGLLALLISTLGIVIFGEIVPQSICVKKGLAVGAHTIMITQIFILITFPIAWPISKLLDHLLGDEYQVYDRKRLMELIRMSMRNDNGKLSNELKIAVGAMEIADKVAEDVMTRLADVFMVPDTTVLNTKMVAEIVRMGYTRIPVYSNGDRNNVTDILFVKDLALLDPDDNFTVKTVCGYHRHPVKFVLNDTPLSILLEAFKKGEGHLAMVKKLVHEEDCDPSYDLVGVVTLEDIVEEILQAEINDEFDVVSDNVNKIKRKNLQQRDMSKMLDKEAPQIQISLQIQMVALQWLVANEEAFSPQYIDTNVLERLIRTSARRVDISALMAMSHDAVNVPRLAKLYTKNEFSDRFVLILEGRVEVTIGQSGMVFEAGPWHCFGSEMLKKLVQETATLSRKTSIVDTSDLSCRRPDLMFEPDYSVVVKQDCTYLDVNVAAYINAYKSTLMQREKGRDDISMAGDFTSRSPSLTSGKIIASNRKESAPILDPAAMLVPERVRNSIIDAREAVKQLNSGENGPPHEDEVYVYCLSPFLLRIYVCLLSITSQVFSQIKRNYLKFVTGLISIIKSDQVLGFLRAKVAAGVQSRIGHLYL